PAVEGTLAVLGHHMGDPAKSLTLPLFVVQQLRAASSCPQQKVLYSSHMVITTSEDQNFSPKTRQLISETIRQFANESISGELSYLLCRAEDILCYSTSCPYSLA